MLQRALILAAVGLPIGAEAQTPADAQQWLCVAEAATGFSFDKAANAWETTRFKIGDLKYIVRRPNDNEKSRFNPSWVVLPIGQQVPSAICRADFADNEIECGGLERFTFNRKTLRYQVVYAFGYVTPINEEGADTPRLEIGRCTPL